MYCVVEADAPYGASTSNTVLLFCKNKNNLLHPNAWSGTDYMGNLNGWNNSDNIIAVPSTDWAANGEKSLKVKQQTQKPAYIEQRVAVNFPKGTMIEGRMTIYNPQHYNGVYIFERKGSSAVAQSYVNIPASDTPTDVVVTHILQNENIESIALRLQKYSTDLYVSYSDNWYLGESENLLKSIGEGGVNNTGITHIRGTASPPELIREESGRSIKFVVSSEPDWWESRIDYNAVPGEELKGNLYIKTPNNNTRVYIVEYKTESGLWYSTATSYVKVPQCDDYQVIEISHVIQEENTKAISLRIAMVANQNNAGDIIYAKMMRLISSA